VRLLTFYGAVLLFAFTNIVANSIVNEVQINAQDGRVDQTRDSNDDGVKRSSKREKMYNTKIICSRLPAMRQAYPKAVQPMSFTASWFLKGSCSVTGLRLLPLPSLNIDGIAAQLSPQKRTPSTLRTWGLEVCCLKSGFFSWAAGVGGWGAAQLGLMSGI
jgi:hypothetical protein